MLVEKKKLTCETMIIGKLAMVIHIVWIDCLFTMINTPSTKSGWERGSSPVSSFTISFNQSGCCRRCDALCTFRSGQKQ